MSGAPVAPSVSDVSPPGDIGDGDQHVSVGADHVRVGLVIDDPPNGPRPPGDGAGERQLQHQHRQPGGAGTYARASGKVILSDRSGS